MFFLAVLVVIENSTVLLTKYTRTDSAALFNIVDMMLLSELCKVLLSLVLEYFHSEGQLLKVLKKHFNFYSADTLKVAVPAFLYFIQNSLFYVALTNLSSPVFQVLYQMKLLTTAFVSILILSRTYTLSQWISLFTLTFGAMITIKTNDDDLNSKGMDHANSKYIIGILAVIVACLCSAFAGVIFEKFLKKKPTEEEIALPEQLVCYSLPSLWMRNIQLGTFSFIFAVTQRLFVSLTSEKEHTDQHPFLFGFTISVWILVLLRASCGILTAVIIKRMDNVVKSIASSVSVIVGCIMSMFIFGTQLQNSFWLGAIIVVTSSFLFSIPRSSFGTYSKIPRIFRSLLISVFILSILIIPLSLVQYSTKRNIDLEDIPQNYGDSLHFVVFVANGGPGGDCGGCNVLWELYNNLQSRNFSASTAHISTKQIIRSLQPPNRTIVGIYPEISKGSISGVDIHVRWILAPVGVNCPVTNTKTWNETDLIFNYATSTGKNVPLTNILQVVNTPAKGDDTDISDELFYSKNRTGIAWMMRKGNRFHKNIIPIHNQTGFISTNVDGKIKVRDLQKFEYFVTYDPYTYWTWFAAMQGTISIVYPTANMTKTEWALGTFLGSYLQELNQTDIPGVAYGWEESEIEYARRTMHELRPFLLNLRKWGSDVTLPRFTRDCYRYSQGKESSFEGALVRKDVYPN